MFRSDVMPQLQIETTNVCNAACGFCPYPTMARAKGTMAMPLFRAIIDDAATIPAIDHITLTGLGEPLLDRFLIERVAYVRSKLPRVQVDLVTNGTFLTHARIDALVEAGLSQLSISLNAVTPEKRKAIMQTGDDFDHVVAMARYAIDHGAPMRTIVKGIDGSGLMESGEPQQFVDTWGGTYDQGGHAFLHLEGNWAGRVWPLRIVPTQACSRALGQIMVLWDGRVSLCCFDGEGQEILGDLKTQSIRDMYNGGRALQIRTAHAEGRRAEIPLCAGCTSI